MMYHPTLEKLAELRLTGMREALLDQQAMADIEELGFDERLGLLLDREATVRADRRLKARLRTARFRQAATVEDLDFHTPRGLDKALMNELIAGRWIKKHLNLLVTGPTAWAKRGSRARSATRPAATASPPSTIASPGCSTCSPSRMATAAIPK